jgi:hypothetical protein
MVLWIRSSRLSNPKEASISVRSASFGPMWRRSKVSRSRNTSEVVASERAAALAVVAVPRLVSSGKAVLMLVWEIKPRAGKPWKMTTVNDR